MVKAFQTLIERTLLNKVCRLKTVLNRMIDLGRRQQTIEVDSALNGRDYSDIEVSELVPLVDIAVRFSLPKA